MTNNELVSTMDNPKQDARLLLLCAELFGVNAEFNALGRPWLSRNDGPPPEVRSAERKAVERMHDLRRRIGKLPAHSSAGVAAKARAALIEISPDDALDGNAVTVSLLRDLVSRFA